ncbi:NAD(P)-dependent oxidoreductase [Vitiosangium sp. GDMCC 1.1324]|uniref:NAD(P)-dependent oxidoreductase n=1 Tax=Vitiosangium sp. (strain GDMCC 1.1324) TaxID=2138576 RepID=UPI000D359FFD|nr:SDR family oxidoreductase [Vitiosangium sp. GDMCC 1.1324]PTL75069.1 glycerol-3-phosphate dehydrogenase [Vitiosangium sp. GDMCC 1.1324]
MSRVIIFGANGRTGRLIVEEALRAGHDVTAAVRTPEKFPPVTVGTSTQQGTMAVVRADVRDPASVQAAVAGHDAVVSAIGPPGRRALGLYSDGARALVTAMERTGVGRIIALSSAGVRHDDPQFAFWYRCIARTLLKELYDDMRLMESIVRESTLDWTFVRPSHLEDKTPTGLYRVQDGGTPPGGWKVTRTDLARFIIRELDEHRWSHAAPTLAQ